MSAAPSMRNTLNPLTSNATKMEVKAVGMFGKFQGCGNKGDLKVYLCQGLLLFTKNGYV